MSLPIESGWRIPMESNNFGAHAAIGRNPRGSAAVARDAG
jgi:hypothetical protein